MNLATAAHFAAFLDGIVMNGIDLWRRLGGPEPPADDVQKVRDQINAMAARLLPLQIDRMAREVNAMVDGLPDVPEPKRCPTCSIVLTHHIAANGTTTYSCANGHVW